MKISHGADGISAAASSSPITGERSLPLHDGRVQLSAERAWRPRTIPLQRRARGGLFLAAEGRARFVDKPLDRSS